MATAATSKDVLPAEEAAAIAALDEAKRQIDIARASEDVDSLLEWRDRAAAVQHYIRKRDEARELADNAGELKVRAEAALGKLDLAVSPGRGRPKKGEDSDTPEAAAPLADFQPNTRSMFRTLGKLEESQLDAVVDKLRTEEDGGVTTARAVKEARSYVPVEAREAAEPTKEARKEVVTDYVAHVRALDTETGALVRMARKMLPVATAGERIKIAERLSNTIAKLEDLRDGITGVAAAPVEAEVVE
jgi:hypothetical protein